MFQSAKNIDTAFRYTRLFSLLVILASTFIASYAVFLSHQSTQAAGARIYVLANGKAMEAFAADRKDNIPVEARDHVSMFHHYFFSLDPDDKVIQTNITKALYLADGSAKQQYDDLRENSYYANIISGNVSQQIRIDSIVIDSNQYPFHFRCFAQQQIIRPTTITSRSLVTEGWLRNVARSDNNPHGFLIEKWRTIENKDIKTVQR